MYKHVLMAALTYNLKKYMKFVSKKVKSKAIEMKVRVETGFSACFSACFSVFWLIFSPYKPTLYVRVVFLMLNLLTSAPFGILLVNNFTLKTVYSSDFQSPDDKCFL